MNQELCNRQKPFYDHIISVSFNFAAFFPEIILQFESLKIMNLWNKKLHWSKQSQIHLFSSVIHSVLTFVHWKIVFKYPFHPNSIFFLITRVNFNFLIWVLFLLYKDLTTTYCHIEKKATISQRKNRYLCLCFIICILDFIWEKVNKMTVHSDSSSYMASYDELG
jgi:hypothetical protein